MPYIQRNKPTTRYRRQKELAHDPYGLFEPWTYSK